MSNAGKHVSVHYRGTLDDGSEFDSSYSRNQPLDFTCMAGQMIPGFDKAVENREVGETVTVRLAPEDAYGERDEDMMQGLPFPPGADASNFEVGQKVMLRGMYGQPMPAVVAEILEDGVIVDLNHELAGKHLTFEITLVSVD